MFVIYNVDGFVMFPDEMRQFNINFLLCVTGERGFNTHTMKISSDMHFLTHIFSVQMNLCQINFRGGSLDFDLVPSCSDCG